MNFPTYSAPNRLAVRLTADAERQLRGGHPWVFDRSVERIKGEAEAGDLALIFSRKKNRLMGIGLLDPSSPIRIRMLHHGGPKTIDSSFFRECLEKALDLRKSKIVAWSKQGVKEYPLPPNAITGYRLLHGENDGMPGLIVDVYAHTLVVKVYSVVWKPWLQLVLTELEDLFPGATVVLRLARQLQQDQRWPTAFPDGSLLAGKLDAPEVIFAEYGLQFKAAVVKGHKTGFFLDHRHNRRRVGELAAGKRVLDVFSFAGGFSLHALAGGAEQVTSLDISPQAQAAAEAHVILNDLDPTKHEKLVGDAFTLLAQLHTDGQQYDLIIVDPPSFAKREKERLGALEAYKKLARLTLPLVAPQGLYLAASCSARISSDEFFTIQELVLQESNRKWSELERSFHDFDHPIDFPEGAYLKAAYYQLD